MTKSIVLLGSTGSIGTQTLESCRRLGISVRALAAHQQTKLLEQQAREFSPACVVISDKTAYADLKIRLADTPIKLLFGVDGMCEAAALSDADTVCNAVVGMVGLRPTLAAIGAGKRIALSNKETLVAGGELVMQSVAQNGVELLPVDSEHSAIFQCLEGNRENAISRILLTASGGPFRGKTIEELSQVTLADALKHPNWSMGAKITIDSSTLMNKGLELIEAMWLFGVSPAQIEVVVHPQSVIHSAVEFADGSVLAQMGVPDMLIPIQYALTRPNRCPTGVKPLSLFEYGVLSFEQADMETFTCLRAAIVAATRGGLYPCAINSANEQAVALFLAGKIGYLQISHTVERMLEVKQFAKGGDSLEQILETDRVARALTEEYCGAKVE